MQATFRGDPHMAKRRKRRPQREHPPLWPVLVGLGLFGVLVMLLVNAAIGHREAEIREMVRYDSIRHAEDSARAVRLRTLPSASDSVEAERLEP